MTERSSKRGFSGAGRIAVIALGLAAALALPFSASAGDHGRYGGGQYRGYHGGYNGGHYGGHYGRGDYGRHYGNNYRDRGHWNGGRWIAGAIVTGAVLGLVTDALRPAPVYYNPRVVYSQPRTVIYRDDYPVVTQRVVERRTVIYDDQSNSRYIRDDGYDRDDGDDRNDGYQD